MNMKAYPYPDGGPDVLKPDAYDDEGYLTINSWYMYMCDEINHESSE